MDHFDKKYKCYVLSFHGFGGVKPDSVADFKQWELSVAQYIKNNHINKPVIIGHSIGGGMAMMLASDYPELISKIVVVDALPCLEALGNPSFVAKQNPDCSSIVNQIVAIPTSQFEAMQERMIPLREVADTAHFRQVLNWSLTSDRKTMAEIFCQFTNTDLRKSISNIQCPSLILLESVFKTMKPAIQA
ncbi:MAG: alpha/beta fold hydrolase, partial [Chitinophagaceae bacterium]